MVRIKPLKARHDVTKLDLTIPLLSLWCIDIDFMRVDELVGFIQTYEMTLPSSQKLKNFVFKAS